METLVASQYILPRIWKEARYRYTWLLEISSILSVFHVDKTHPFPLLPMMHVIDEASNTPTPHFRVKILKENS